MHPGGAVLRSYALAALAAVALGRGICALSAQVQEGTRLTGQEIAARREKAGKDPVALLELVPLVGDEEARRIRQQVKALLADRKQNAGPGELERLTRGVARVLPAAARSPADLRELFGPPRQILRQVLYRRYREQWHYDTPLSLCVVLEGARGQAARAQSVLLPGGGNP